MQFVEKITWLKYAITGIGQLQSYEVEFEVPAHIKSVHEIVIVPTAINTPNAIKLGELSMVTNEDTNNSVQRYFVEYKGINNYNKKVSSGLLLNEKPLLTGDKVRFVYKDATNILTYSYAISIYLIGIEKYR